MELLVFSLQLFTIPLYPPPIYHSIPSCIIPGGGTSGRNGTRFSYKPSNKAIYYSLYNPIYSIQPILALLYNYCSSCSTCSTRVKECSNCKGYSVFPGGTRPLKKWNRWNELQFIKVTSRCALTPRVEHENRKVEQRK